MLNDFRLDFSQLQHNIGFLMFTLDREEQVFNRKNGFFIERKHEKS